jgi:two-component system cell cycle sensor histidine kinase/response regulator CckA
VSGFSATDRVQELLELGAGSYVKKPYNIDGLSKALRKELDKTLILT